jgi:glutamine synthetase
VGGVHQMSTRERIEAGVEVLPADLNEAIRCARESELARRVLGDNLFEKVFGKQKAGMGKLSRTGARIRN